MKILHVISSLDPRAGGPSTVVRSVVAGQAAAGHEVALATTSAQVAEPWQPTDDYCRRLADDEAFRNVALFVGRAVGRRRPWSTFAYCPQARRWIGERLAVPGSRPAVIHIHGTFEYLAVAAAAAARRHGIPYVFEPYGSLHDDCLHMGSRHMKALFFRLFVRKMLRGAACVHPASEFEAEAVRRFVPADRVQVIPHGVSLPPEGWRRAGPLLLERYPALARKRVILLLGRVHPIKRFDWAVEAVGRLRAEFPDLAVLLVGNDEGHLPHVTAAARRHGLGDAFVHAGFLDGAAREGAFALAAALVLPSQHENFGLAAVEAMAHGLPVLVTPGVAVARLAESSGAGLIAHESTEGVASGLRRLLASDLVAMGQCGEQFVAKELSWGAVLHRLETLYGSVCAPAHS